MAYARFGENSDIYMWSSGDLFYCSECPLLLPEGSGEDWTHQDPVRVLEHLREHDKAGHATGTAIERLEREIG
jgi:hypothetical protein